MTGRRPKPAKTYGRLQYGVDPRDRGVWVLTLEPHVMTRIKRLFPRVDVHRSGAVWIYDTPDVSRDLEWVESRWPLDMTAACRKILGGKADDHRAREQTVAKILSGHAPPTTWREPLMTPRDYQLTADAMVAATGRLLLLDEVGLGKSLSAILRFRDPGSLPALFVTLTHLPEQMQEEIAKAMPWLTTHILRGTTPYDPVTKRGVDRDPDVLITSYSKMATWGHHLAGQIRTVVFDEIQELRSGSGTLKYQGAAQVADEAVYREGLSATPVFNYGDETWNIVNIIAPDALGTREEFLREWCTPIASGKHKVKDPAVLGGFLRGEGVTLRRTRKEVGRELPPVQVVPHTVPVDDHAFWQVADNLGVTAFAEAVLSLETTRETRFTASGELDWRLRQATGIAKAPYVADFAKLLLESEDKIVLYSWHREVYRILLDRLKDYQPMLYTGSENPGAKGRAKAEFMSNPDRRILIMSLRSGAGLNGLQEVAKVCVFGELDWSPQVHTQAIGRLRRDGMGDEPVVAYYLLSESGSDPVIMDVLGVKRPQNDLLVDPDAPVLTQTVDTSDRIRRLAEAALNRR